VALDLAAEGDSTRARASLEDIAVDVAELETIVDDILTAMRFEFGRAELPLRRAPVEPGAIANTAAERLRARHPGRTLEVSVAAELPEIDVDPVLFRRVVDNLLENAHKYTPDTTSPIALNVTRDPSNVVFEVVDRGVGIAADDLAQVFTAFFRGDRSRSRETGGVGLGLTLARRIAVAHGATISLASEVGAGTTARLTIPA
jgi:signal transduction histidine kinase